MKRPLREALVILRGLTCLHRRMLGGYWNCHCPDCGLEWDDGDCP